MPQQLKRVVLADDDADDIEVFKEALSQACPYAELNIAKDGSELMQLLTQISVPDLIILDINMPRLSGKQCLQKIRANKKFDHVPVVMLTTSSNQQDIDFCLANGANKFFTKPPNFYGVKHIIEDICKDHFELA